MALKLNMEGTRSGEPEEPSAPSAAPLWGYPADSSARVIVTARRMIGAGANYSAGGVGVLVGLAQAVAAEQEDLGVFDQPVGDGGGDGRIEEDVAPVGERRVGGDDG